MAKKTLPPGVRERDGRFTYRYSVNVMENGKKKRKWKETPSYPTAKAAADAGALIRADQLRGKNVDAKKITVEAWRDKWIEDYKTEREATPNTVSTRMNATNSFIKHVGKDTLLRDIAVDEWQGWLNKLKRDGKAQGTLRGYHKGVNIMFRDAMRLKVLTVNPGDDVTIPVYKQTVEEIEAGEQLPKYCEKDELKRLLNVIRFQDEQDYRIAVVLTYTGMRIGELAGMKTTDFDQTEQALSITKNATIKGSVKTYHIGPPKNKSSVRKVTIGNTAIKAITEQLSWRERLKDSAIHDADFLFWSIVYPGYPMIPTTFEQRFRRYVAAAGLPNSITPHSLRHTHVSLLAEAGEALSVIQERLGHKNDRITELVYRHVTKGQRKLTPDRFEKVMRG